MSPAFGPGLSSTPCCSCDLSTVEGCSGPATVALGGGGAEAGTAAPGAAWPAPCVGSGAVACGETCVVADCATAAPAPASAKAMTVNARNMKLRVIASSSLALSGACPLCWRNAALKLQVPVPADRYRLGELGGDVGRGLVLHLVQVPLEERIGPLAAEFQ